MELSVRELPIGVLDKDVEHICGCPVPEHISITEWNGKSNVCLRCLGVVNYPTLLRSPEGFARGECRQNSKNSGC